MMGNSFLKASGFLEKYGPEATQNMLLDLLETSQSDQMRREIEDAINELDFLICDQGTNTEWAMADQTEFSEQITRLPPAYEKNCVELWMFDDAIISRNTLIDFYHGYHKYGDHTVALTPDELSYYKSLINDPRKILKL